MPTQEIQGPIDLWYLSLARQSLSRAIAQVLQEGDPMTEGQVKELHRLQARRWEIDRIWANTVRPR